jgi:ABC-type nitrate/sulfonate/bicarbonate transport system substrate-binding protein
MTGRIEVLWYTRCPSPTASSIAVSGGFLQNAFAGTGIEVRSLRVAAERSARQSHFTQGHPALFRQGGIVPPLWAASRGTPTRLIGLSEVPRFQGIIALPDSGITDPLDLKGRRLGLPRRTAEPVDFWRAHTWRGLLKGLTVAGLNEDDVRWIDLPTAAPFHVSDQPSPDASLWTAREASRLQAPEVGALVRGEVDAIYTYSPAGLPLIELLDARVVVSLPMSGHTAAGIGTLAALTVSQGLIDDSPDLVARYVRALLEAARWAVDHRGDALRVFAAEEGVAEEWAIAAFGSQATFDLTPRLSPHLLSALQVEADFLLERGFLERRVDVADWSDAGPLRLANEQLATHVDHPSKERQPAMQGRLS